MRMRCAASGGLSLGIGDEPMSKSRFEKLASSVSRVPLVELEQLELGKMLGAPGPRRPAALASCAACTARAATTAHHLYCQGCHRTMLRCLRELVPLAIAAWPAVR